MYPSLQYPFFNIYQKMWEIVEKNVHEQTLGKMVTADNLQGNYCIYTLHNWKGLELQFLHIKAQISTYDHFHLTMKLTLTLLSQ